MIRRTIKKLLAPIIREVVVEKILEINTLQSSRDKALEDIFKACIGSKKEV